jgi:HEAT repeat protein
MTTERPLFPIAALARSLTRTFAQEQALVAAAEAIAAAGDPDRAETLARSLNNRHARALAAAAEATVAAGDPDRAETLARSLNNPHAQAQALAAVARATAAAGDLDRAGRLLCAVLATASWQVPLPVVAEHWPQVVLRCVDGPFGNERW